MNRAMRIIGLAGTIVTLGGSMALATSAGGWTPASSADANSIIHASGYVYNADNTNYHWVSATGIGAPFFNSAGTMNQTVYVKGNGLSLTCYLTAINTDTGSSTYGSNSTSANAYTKLNLSVTVTTGTWFFDLSCSLPPASGGVVSRVLGSY